MGVARAHNLLSTLVYSIYTWVLYSYLRGEERTILEMMMGEREERMDGISGHSDLYIHMA